MIGAEILHRRLVRVRSIKVDAASLACSLRWSTSCLTSAEELAGSPICVASASCCNSGMLGGVCASQSHHIAHPRYSAGQVRIQTFFPNQSLFISFVVLLAQWSNLEEGSWMFFSIYHHYGPYGQIDVVRIIVFRACPFSKDECPTHVISAKGFVSEVNSLLVFTFGHQESRTDSLALLSFFPIGYGSLVSVISFYGFSIWLWLRYRLKTFFRALISAGGSRVVIAPDHPKNYWKTMHGMLFQLCVHVLIFVMLAFFYCLIAWQLFQIFRIVTAPFIAIKLPSSLDDGPSCFCLMETRVQPLVLRIFTENSISPGPCRRQRGSRYTIRAGRYLCDKEFRYLRTVRVTAAVYRGFHSKLITLLLPTFQHRAGVRLYTSCYHLAESCVFNKQSLPPVHREDCPPISKFFPGSLNLVDYDNSRDYKQTRDYGRAACLRSFPGVGKAKWGHPSPLSALPRAIDIIRSTEIDFAENQLYPILVGLSPLATSHPRILPHTWVRSSKAC
ncbi:hypothetical protein RIF29_48392 [Crotalaria pallida]|uniref:Uncharacterized protein n=1 Tax=Crotalaria pallida TaxID=3830 RepID=A0AAN9DRT1_CROPI